MADNMTTDGALLVVRGGSSSSSTFLGVQANYASLLQLLLLLQKMVGELNVAKPLRHSHPLGVVVLGRSSVVG